MDSPAALKRKSRYCRMSFPAANSSVLMGCGHWAISIGRWTLGLAMSDVVAAKAFFKKALVHQERARHTITLNGYAPPIVQCMRGAATGCYLLSSHFRAECQPYVRSVLCPTSIMYPSGSRM